MARRGVHRGDALPRALRPKRTPAETLSLRLLLAGAVALVVVFLPISPLREADKALLACGASLMVGWVIVSATSVSARPDEPRWHVRMQRVATALTTGGLTVALVATVAEGVLGLEVFQGWLWGVRIAGILTYAIGSGLKE
ncbi:hypothetical protein FE697_014575 [Mumia zhuanghuii]|uniref:Uncharacterized protein n=2 Tax=Mumia TaxID=1546255 RepID=A0ABW1QPU0_9ACTN|nr:MULTISPECIES: hypothetical protein [Mumia]KAA1422375.1 hypothetical protein FE697_014575 [Mumia zhuanghuii]